MFLTLASNQDPLKVCVTAKFYSFMIAAMSSSDLNQFYSSSPPSAKNFPPFIRGQTGLRLIDALKMFSL